LKPQLLKKQMKKSKAAVHVQVGSKPVYAMPCTAKKAQIDACDCNGVLKIPKV